MDNLQAIQRFVDEIERQLEEPIDIDQAIRLTFVSKFHFYRLFKAVSGISVHEYVRRRKLVRAAADLRISDEDVLEIAFKYGFGSQEVFTRNFKKLFNNTPAKYRKQHKDEADAYEMLTKIDIESIRLKLKARHGSVAVQDQIERIEELKLIGIERGSNEDNVKSIFPFIQTFIGQTDQISNRKSDTVYRLCYDIAFNGEKAVFKEMIAVEVESFEEIPSGMKSMEIDGLNMIKYVHRGKLFQDDKDNILSTYNFLYGYRIAASKVKLTNELQFEKYGLEFKSPYDDDSQMEIYLSVL